MSEPIDSMAGELIYHRTRAGGVCSCGHVFRPGTSIMHHRALAAYTAMTLGNLGISEEGAHEAVMTTLRLLGKLNEPTERLRS